MQPATFRGVERHTRLRTTQQLPQRQALALRTPIPQGRVHAGQGQAGHRAHRRGMRVKEQIFPNRLNTHRVATDQTWRQVVFEQGDHRRAAGADGVGITRGHNAVAAVQAEQDGFLRHEGLNGIGAQHLGRQIDLPKAHAVNGDSGHGQLGAMEEKRVLSLSLMGGIAGRFCDSGHAGLCGVERA